MHLAFYKGAKNCGWNAQGVEPNEKNAHHAIEKLGLNVHNISVEEVEFPDSSFDLIIAPNILSHLQNPL